MSLNTMRMKFANSAKWIMGAVTVAMVIGTFAGLGSNLGPAQRGGGGGAAAANETVATVNGEPITRAEYAQSTQNQSRDVTQAAFMHASALDQLVTAKLMLAQAKKLGITVSDSDIEKARLTLVQQAKVAESLGLKPTASLAEIDAARAKAGVASIEELTPDESLRQSVTLQKLQTNLANGVNVTEQQARDSYEQWHTRHILISNKSRSDVQAKAQAQQILAKAKAFPQDFAALAKQYSEDPGTKAKGGDDGWIDQSTGYVPEFKKAAFALKAGEVTPELVASPQYGYFIIKADARRPNLPKDFDKNKANYIATVKTQKQNEVQTVFIKGLKDNPANKITVADPQLKADRELLLAAQASDPGAKDSGLRTAVADYQTALKKTSGTQNGEIQAALAIAYQQLKQTPQAITALEAAVKATENPQLRLQLGQLYQQNKQTDKAVEQYQAASKQAWNDQNLHLNVMMAYSQLKRKDLMAQEQDWLKKYQDRQKASQATLPGSGGPITLQGPDGKPIKLTTHRAGGSAAPSGPKPGQ